MIKKIAFTWLVCIPGLLLAQNILKIQEIDDEGEPYEGRKIADINSEIQIYLDKEQLKQIVKKQMPEKSRLVADSLIGQVEALQGIMARSLPLLGEYEDKMRAWALQGEEEKDIEDLLTVVEPLAEIEVQLIEFSEGIPLNERLLETVDGLPGASDLITTQAIFKTTENYLLDIQRQLKEILTQNTGSIQLGAWINSQSGLRPLHLPGFDHFQPGEPYEVGRFDFSAAEQQRENLNHIVQAVDSVGRFGIQPSLRSFIDNIKPNMNQLLENMLSQTREFVAEALDSESGLVNLYPGMAPYINNLTSETERYIRFLDSVKTKYSKPVPSSTLDVVFLAESTGDLALFIENTNNLVQALQPLRESVSNMPAAPGSLPAGNLGSISAFVEKLKSSESWATGLIIPGQNLLGYKRVNDELLNFPKEVIEHDLVSLPSETRFSLLHAGPRKDGDILVIRLGVSTSDEPIPRTLERHDLRLYRQFYIETKTSMAFVDHLSQTQEERKQFQLAPSYSVLFKWGNRKKVAYNQFWRPGIGLNIASPDLSLDEAPDIALSLTGSIINDWIQAGGGYNVTGEAPYWFFALRLPIISLAPNSLDTGQMPMVDH